MAKSFKNSLQIPVIVISNTVKYYNSASILAYMPVQIKSPQFCGIFHALTSVWTKITPFYTQKHPFLYKAPFSIVKSTSIDCSNKIPYN